MRIARSLAILGAAFALTATLTGPAAADAPSPRGACPDRGNEVTIPGGFARWDVNCNPDGTVSVTGDLEDTALDGVCAEVEGVNPANNQHQFALADGWGQVVAINMNLGQGNIAEVRLSTVRC